MLPRAYLALVWGPDPPGAAAEVEAIEARLARDGGWRRRGRTERSSVWVLGEAGAVCALPAAAGFVIGDLFPGDASEARGSPLGRGAGGDRRPADLARALAAGHWGRYVALLHGPPPGPSAVFRDPGGQLGCLTWARDDGVDVVASDLRPTPTWLRPGRLSLHWGRIAGLLAGPATAICEPLFEGMDAVAPGDLRVLGPGPVETRPIWRPADHVTEPGPDPADARRALAARVDACTAELVRPYERVLMELSGGLDSAIVAGAIAAAGLTARVGPWLNHVGDRPEGDEQRYARAVTERLGVDLTTARKPLTPLTADGLAEMAAATWPAINAADESRDRDEAAALAACGAQAVVSGQGGDAVFYQMPTALVLADALRRQGWRTLGSGLAADVARRLRRSVWSVLGEAVRDLRRGTVLGPARTLAPDALAALGARDHHPWLADARARGVSAARRIQIAGLVNAQLLHGDSRRARQADLLYPLLAQPVVELCLGIPTSDLAAAPFDRPLARAAFAGRVPELILQRRSKGDLTSYFSRLAAVSLPVLRPLLLDGCLCEAGVLDRARVEAALTPDQLIWRGGATEILWAAVTESWVRHWQGQVPDSDRFPRAAARARG
jgi:asparagine synthase (glutamine-hydrolysing)